MNPPARTPASASRRVGVDGKFFRLGEGKFYVKGVAYGPFAPNARGEPFGSAGQTARDFAQLRELGANVLRVYYVPPKWFLDLAAEHGLKLWIDLPWQKHLCFLDSAGSRAEIRDLVRRAVTACQGHPAVFAFSVVNEIPPDIVRWSGVRTVSLFIDELVDVAKAADPEGLCTFTSFPPTEFLHPQNIDFVSFNVYLHDPNAYGSYLARLQSLANEKPLVLGEFGIDSIREGEANKCRMLAWQIEGAFRAGLAGTVVFSFTDDWFRGGQQIDGWAFGLTTRDRTPKDSFAVVRSAFRTAPHFPLPRTPRVSVVVASHNGARTLTACLDSLSRLNYPDYEIILVDDGSTDATPEIARRYPNARHIRQDHHGLSVARNTGTAAATGEIVAFTDSDCRADEDWLYYLVGDLISGDFVGIGGHNFLPPEDSPVAAAVLVSPGGPAHVMLTDCEAEHVPGCNMAFYKWALEQIGGFDPVFHAAGDDVDVCWRLQERGHRIAFSPGGFVWHYRRSSARAYLRQQAGYGQAEALLARKHPEYFNFFGGGLWRGRIYTAAKSGLVLRRPVIYHGTFGSGFFQKLYASRPAFAPMLCASIEYHVLVTLPLLALSATFQPLLPLAVASFALSLGVGITAAAQAALPKKKRRFWSRPLVALLFLLQPIVRGWARYTSQLNLQPGPRRGEPHRLTPATAWADTFTYWSDQGHSRYTLLGDLLNQLARRNWQFKPDSGWNDHDVEIAGNRWTCLRLITATEELAAGKTSIRCRLRATWSFQARMLFWLMTALAALAIVFGARALPWLWMSLPLLPLYAWFLDFENRRFRAAAATLLNEIAAERNWVRLEPRVGEAASAPRTLTDAPTGAAAQPGIVL